jgi:hypothetical protein
MRSNFWVAMFTGLLVIVALLQYLAYVKSESASLTVQKVRFATGEPTSDAPLTLIMTIRNPSKNIADVREVNVSTYIGVRQKELPDEPDYDKMIDTAVMPPIAPGIVYPFVIRGDPLNPGNTLTQQIVSDLLNGGDPFYVFGRIKYNSGYDPIGFTEVGYCFQYVPPGKRADDTFEVCKKPKYTYLHHAIFP